MTEAVETFIAAVSLNLRQALFRQLKDKGLSQDQITQLVASATRKAVEVTGITDLATMAHATGPVVAALSTADPTNTALANYETTKGGIRDNVRDLYDEAVIVT